MLERRSHAWCLVVALVLAGCPGQVSLGGANPQGDAEVPDGGGASPGPDAQGPQVDAQAPQLDAQGPDAGPGPADGEAVLDSNASGDAACSATCSTPGGTIVPIMSQQQAYGMVEGRWLTCDNGDAGLAAWVGAGAPSDTVGIEFGPGTVGDASCGAIGNCGGGDYYYLVNGPNGPVRGNGFAYQGTYVIFNSSGNYQFNLESTSSSFYPTSMAYSQCPKVLGLEYLGTLVPIQ